MKPNVIKAILLVLLMIVIIWGFANSNLFKRKRIPFDLSKLPIPESAEQFSILSANVGNSDLRCRKYFWKLCITEVEETLAKNIQSISPDIIVFQEILADWQCQEAEETNPKTVCSQAHQESQMRRLVGPEYTIVCDPDHNMQCTAVHIDFGRIVGVQPGAEGDVGRSLGFLDECSRNFNVFAVTVETNTAERFDVVNVHLNSRADECRTAMIEKAFGLADTPSIIQEENVVLMGDFNTDILVPDLESSKLWGRVFEDGWAGKSFRYHTDTGDPKVHTFQLGLIKTRLDYVVSNFLYGQGVVLGVEGDSPPLDSGRGMDHFAILGHYSLKGE